MKVRKATKSDIKELSNLFDAYRVFYEKESDLAGAAKFISDRIDAGDSKIFICVSEEKFLTGFVQLYPVFSSTKMQRMWILNDLYVSPNFRGKGISVMLIDAAKHLAKESNACGLLLETGKSNEIGNKLYPRAGFSLNASANFYEWKT